MLRAWNYFGCIMATTCILFYCYMATMTPTETINDWAPVSNLPLIAAFVCLAWFVEPVDNLRRRLYNIIMGKLESLNPSNDRVIFIGWRIPRGYGVALLVIGLLLWMIEAEIALQLVGSYSESAFGLRLLIAGVNVVAEMFVLLLFFALIDSGMEILSPGFASENRPKS